MQLLDDSTTPSRAGTHATVDVKTLNPMDRYAYAHGRLLSGMLLARRMREAKQADKTKYVAVVSAVAPPFMFTIRAVLSRYGLILLPM